jgi:hypothetical protein
MARAAHLTYPAPVLAGTRPARASHTISRATALGACLFLLSAIGSGPRASRWPRANWPVPAGRKGAASARKTASCGNWR